MTDIRAILRARLDAAVGGEQVLSDPAAVEPYVSDWRGRYHGRALAVVRPGSTEQVAAVVRVCADLGVPMVPQGGNTGQCGGATPDDRGNAIVVSLARMNRVRAVDTANATLTAVPGIKVGHFTLAERPTGCTVVLIEGGAVAGVEVRGAAPATSETDLLAPEKMVQEIYGIDMDVIAAPKTGFPLAYAC